MFSSIYFIGTGCGKPIIRRQLPAYLISLKTAGVILLECGTTLNTDDEIIQTKLNNINTILISSAELELFCGLPSLLHSMRLLNRTKSLRLIAPKSVNNIIKQFQKLDTIQSKFDIQYIQIEKHKATALSKEISIITKEAHNKTGKYQFYLKDETKGKERTLFYTSKSNARPDKSLLSKQNIIIHDCTYSYDDGALAEKNRLASYKDVLNFSKEFEPEIIFLVHFSTRYKNPLQEITKHRIQQKNIIITYDGYRYDFVSG